MKPLTICGGGLAGLALGIALRRQSVPVRVVEAAVYPRHRVCGEFISGIKEHELAALGIEDLFQSAAMNQQTAWFDGGRLMFRAQLPEVAYGLSRHHLDDALAERFTQLGGELIIKTRYEGNAETEGLVLASGRPQRTSSWVGLKAHFENLPLSADLEIHLGHRSYIGLTRVEHERVNVTGLFHRTSPVSGGPSPLVQAVHEAGLPELAERLNSAQMDRGSMKGVNRFHLGWQSHRDTAVRIGDAAVMIPPFTGNGMTMALQSALCAVDPIMHWSRGGLTWAGVHRTIQQEHGRLFTQRLRWARGLQWLLLMPLGRRLSGYCIRNHWIRFESLYRKLR